MPKFNPKQAQMYVQTLQNVLTNTEDTATRVTPFFTKLDDAKAAGKIAEIPAAEFAEIKAEFEDAVASYQANAAKLNAASAPVRLLGVHKSLASAYAKYADATQLMADAVVVSDQSVADDKYAQSEEEQGIYLEKIHAAVAKIMNANM
ncbi:chemotaxis protein [Leuconostoc holzapfelii]|uniref:Chemotaxis protein n=1 Tax=Leuconostoc holzapfelii TaxID=434464 RepID=A0A846Z882_9LACO|nr:chemotaxis protein [Leuconostoc holzapfelii]NKZ17917.1 chemotaxis protein [Leuconostoc holzapfelii]